MHNADILFKDNATVDDLIDVIEGNRRYVKCLYVYNKIDVCSIEEIDDIARRPNSIPASAGMNLNMDGLLEAIWEKMGLVRVYTKKVVFLLKCPRAQHSGGQEPTEAGHGNFLLEAIWENMGLGRIHTKIVTFFVQSIGPR